MYPATSQFVERWFRCANAAKPTASSSVELVSDPALLRQSLPQLSYTTAGGRLSGQRGSWSLCGNRLVSDGKRLP
jgi:hypothetical protein